MKQADIVTLNVLLCDVPCVTCCLLHQALLTREQFYTQYSKNLVERDTYRKQIRELGERCDEMQLQLFQKESQLLATEAKLKRLQLELPALVGLWGRVRGVGKLSLGRVCDCYEL